MAELEQGFEKRLPSLKEMYDSIRRERNELRDRHDKSGDFRDASNIKAEIRGMDRTLSQFEKVFNEHHIIH